MESSNTAREKEELVVTGSDGAKKVSPAGMVLVQLELS